MSDRKFAEDYVDVATRIAMFRDKFPEGTLQPFDPAEPVKVITVGDRVHLQYVACAYRTPDDPRPGIGIAWEPFPGGTPFTKGSEAMVAETSAWGRAIVAAMAADTKRGVASKEEVYNAQARQQEPSEHVAPPQSPANVARSKLAAYATEQGMDLAIVAQEFLEEGNVRIGDASADQVELFLRGLKARMPA